MHLISWAIVMSLFWLLLSGFFQPLLLSFGAISVALVLWLIIRMDTVDNTKRSLDAKPRTLSYLVWLGWQIVLSSLDVAKLIWRSPNKVSPAIETIKTGKLKDKGRVLYANSITLTPGTLSVDLSDDSITVHALRSESLEELKAGSMEQNIAKSTGEE